MIELKNIYKSFGDRCIFDNFNLTVKDGEFVVFSGVSGCGKTTLLNIIGSLEPIDRGEISVDGIDITKKKNQNEYLKNKVGFLFQNFALIDTKTVAENLNLLLKKSRSGISITKALEKVGLQGSENTPVYKLSGGEQQRVALARLMMKKCDIILADEPTGSLDKDNALLVFNILKQLNTSGKTVIVVTHDESLGSLYGRMIKL